MMIIYFEFNTPNSVLIAKARAVFPVPGGPAINTALPAIFLALIRSTITPAAYYEIERNII